MSSRKLDEDEDRTHSIVVVVNVGNSLSVLLHKT